MTEENQMRICPVCEARWISGQHYWATGRPGGQNSEKDLAGLVCNSTSKPGCINPCKGDETGDSWKKRQDRMNIISEEFDWS
jgi:hypothetical protein